MVLFDMHYHLNLDFCSKSNRAVFLEKQHQSLAKTKVDYIVSTEHVYKNALDAYLYLSDITETLTTTVLPGVEWISCEGIDIIFIFDSENALNYGLKHLKPFSNSVWEINKIKKDLNSITIIPHPFTPGKTGAAIQLGEKKFIELLNYADYVEIHNGLSILFLQYKYLYSKCPVIFQKKQQQIENTYKLPPKFKIKNIGWAVGSDSHFPNEQRIVGVTDLFKGNWFDFLKKRIHFKSIEISSNYSSKEEVFRNTIRNLRCVTKEAMMKFSMKKKYQDVWNVPNDLFK